MTHRRILMILMTLALTGCDELLQGLPDGGEPEALVGDCEANDALREALLDERLGDAIRAFDTLTLDVAKLRDAFREGTPVTLPMVSLQGERLEVELTPRPWVDGSTARESHLKGPEGELLRSVQAPSEITFQLGCESSEVPCGVFTFLDADDAEPERFEAMIVDPREGWTVIESVPSLWENLDLGDQPPGDKCGVVYNSAFHGAIEFDDEEEGIQSFGGGAVDGKSWIIPIVLDADETYYNQNPATAWSRQRSVLANMNFMYHLIEPLSSGSFDILFALKAQEAWVTAGTGPSTTDKVALSDEINDVDYPMITHPVKNELSYFFVGYDMSTSIAGRAGGICNVAGYDDTFGSDVDNQKNHAWGQQVPDSLGYQFATLYGRSVVMAHEIGHMIGATHGDGDASGCAGGGMPSLCGSSMMRSGAAGGADPDFRQPYFTDLNDANIIGCVGDVLP